MVHRDPADGDVRRRTAALIRQRQDALAADVSAAIETISSALDAGQWHGCADVLVRLFAASADAGSLDPQSAAMRDLARCVPPLTTRQLLDAVHHAERVILDEVALDDRLGATSEPWAAVAHTLRRASLEIMAAHAEQAAGLVAAGSVRDALTTLIAPPVFDLVVAQEIERALRHRHALSVLLFDIDDLARINREHGYGVGDRLLERMGILARAFFRLHDWVARHDGDAITALLPETTLDQAALLARGFRDMVQQRLVLQDHHTEAKETVTISAAAVGTDLVHSDLSAASVMAEADAAVRRARAGGRRHIERVALLPTSFTIFGAASLLGETPRAVARLVRDGSLEASRRGRHLHIYRELLQRRLAAPE